jgi:hypothetical protein
MCRRAFLSWRFAKSCNSLEGATRLQLLLRREREEDYFPELTGFDNFFQLCDHGFTPFIDADRFEATEPLELYVSNPSTVLIIKCCLMETATLRTSLRHIVRSLRCSSFSEVLLSVDRTRRTGLLRQHAEVDEAAFDQQLTVILSEGLVDRICDFDGAACSV